MLNDLRIRIALILALAALAAWSLYDRGIVLGLDLRGGTHLAIEVSNPTGALNSEQRAEATDRALTILRTRVDAMGVAEPTIQKSGTERIIIELPGATQEQQQRARNIIQQSAALKFQIVQPMSLLSGVIERMDRAAAAAGLEEESTSPQTPSSPTAPGLGLFETAPDTTDPSASDTTGAAVQDTAGTDTAAAVASDLPNLQPISSRLMPASSDGSSIFMVPVDEVPMLTRYLELPAVQALLPRGTVFRWGTDPQRAQTGARTLYLLAERELISGTYLIDAQAQRDPQFGRPLVLFEFNRQGGRIFERGTGANVGNLMAIVLDDQVVSAPEIRSQISTRGQIELGGGSIEEARDLALVLRAGALPAPIEIVEERSVGPTLGQDSIDQGRLAGIIGLSLVVLIMLMYYRVAGAMAVAALALYVLFVLASLSAVGAALTLPGIAGLILSIGMAVDANVLIFERIREELAAGRAPRVAVSEGFSNALSAIVDAQITTLLTALVLYNLGTGPVQGFAVTLAIGIVASMFSAIFVTRTFFMLYLNRRPAVETVSI